MNNAPMNIAVNFVIVFRSKMSDPLIAIIPTIRPIIANREYNILSLKFGESSRNEGFSIAIYFTTPVEFKLIVLYFT